MAKRNKQVAVDKSKAANSLPAGTVAHEPATEPTLLAVSVVLFALWFVFLAVTAWLG